jgi:L-ascorbate metabolism protein UlaG (beta-lactamase superfamily)
MREKTLAGGRAMATDIFWHGHANFQITVRDAAAQVGILIDPFFTGNPACSTSWKNVGKPDMVLVTHDHSDHVGDAVRICKETGARCYCVVETAASLVRRGLPDHLIGAAFNIGGSVEAHGVRLTMTPAFHTSESGVPAGYVLRLPDGTTIYHAGDTGLFGDMSLIGRMCRLDLALLPVGDLYTMDAGQAAQACALLRPGAVIPMLWGTFPALAQSPDEFAALAQSAHPGVRVIALRPGQSVTL